MTNSDQDLWIAVKDRLRAEVGNDIFSSWFARMEVEGIENDTVKLSVPTRFLKSWVQSHYAEKLLGCWQSVQQSTSRIELTVRSAVIRTAIAKPKVPDVQAIRTEAGRGHGGERIAAAPISAAHEALGGSPLDPRLTFETFVVGGSHTLAHAAAKQVA